MVISEAAVCGGVVRGGFYSPKSASFCPHNGQTYKTPDKNIRLWTEPGAQTCKVMNVNLLLSIKTIGVCVCVCVCVYCTSDICVAVLPLVPSITIARAEEMLNGEKKIFAVLSLSLSFLNKAREKSVLALDRGVDDAIVSDTKRGEHLLIHYKLTASHLFIWSLVGIKTPLTQFINLQLRWLYVCINTLQSII